ncbi:MAG: hypothetical protein IPJ69_02375 [Deltaproteobacteria bacterium]|nr:MAG: hypothetical protein IPJ69_02375 [Deltaproteobacteria bacterium]
MQKLITQAKHHLDDILRDSLRMQPHEKALVLFDSEAPLTHIMTEAYRQALPEGRFLDVASKTPEEVIQIFDALNLGDLVVLVQSTNFRLAQFRLRLELFQRNLKTIEHTQLSRMVESQFATYIESLAYDASYYQSMGSQLKSKLDSSQKVVVTCAGTQLVYGGPMEEAKMNIGNYEGMKNVGGTFPIGEVFTELRDLSLLNGEAMVFGFAGDQYLMKYFTPFLITIRNGVLIADEGPDEFKVILEKLKKPNKSWCVSLA